MKKFNRTIFTIGHSTLAVHDFIGLLKDNGIEVLADIRTIPKSAHNPQFNQTSLEKSLRASGIAYLHLKELGGLRHTTKSSLNSAWRNLSFRGFADYMQTPEFAEGIKKLIDLAAKKTIAIMCAEAVPWRCHRSLIGDALLVRKYQVLDIIGKKVTQHKITPWAKVRGEEITYPLT